MAARIDREWERAKGDGAMTPERDLGRIEEERITRVLEQAPTVAVPADFAARRRYVPAPARNLVARGRSSAAATGSGF